MYSPLCVCFSCSLHYLGCLASEGHIREAVGCIQSSHLKVLCVNIVSTLGQWYMYSQDTQKERKTKQHKTTQSLRQPFSKEKELHLRWDLNPCLTHSRRDTLLPTELPRQLSWLSSNHPYKSKQSKAKQVSKPDKQVNLNLVLQHPYKSKQSKAKQVFEPG